MADDRLSDPDRRRSAISRWLLADLAVGLAALALYWLTLAPDVLASDAGEFQVVAATWGVAHPPGFPLYTMLAGVFAHLFPVGSLAWRANLFSALIGALAVALTSAITRRETGQAHAGWLAALALMVASTFWLTATQAGVRTLTALLFALMLEAALAYRRAVRAGQAGRGALLRFGAAAGLGVTHHGSLLFLGLLLALGIVLADRRAWRRWPLALGAALTGALPWLYLVAKGLNTWGTFLDHVLARGFTGDVFTLLSPGALGGRWWAAREIFALQWPGLALFWAGVGLLLALRRDRWLGGLLAGGLLVHTLVTVSYPSSATVDYALPALLLAGVCMGIAAAQGRQGWQALALVVLVLAPLLAALLTGWVGMRRYAARPEARQMAQITLDQAPPGALILAPWHRLTPLDYLQKVEGARPDVAVDYVFPQGTLTPIERWTTLIAESIQAGDRPLLVTQHFPEAYRHLPVTFSGQAVLPAAPPPAPGAATVTFGPHALALDWRWLHPADGALRAGDDALLVLTWQLGEAVSYGALTTFVHLGQAGQPPLSQVDLPVQAPSLAGSAGEVQMVYDLHIPATLPPGEWTLFAGAYTPEGSLLAESGEPRVPIGTVTVQPAAFPLPTQHPMIVYRAGATLRGWDYDATGGVLTLHWRLPARAGRYLAQVSSEAGTSEAAAHIAGHSGGHWTSAHRLPPDAAQGSVQVALNGRRVVSVQPDPRQRYVIVGSLGVLTGWQVRADADRVVVDLSLLPLGATYSDVNISVRVDGEGWSQSQDFVPVSGHISSYKWAYGRLLRTRQEVALDHAGPPTTVRVLFYDGYSGRMLFVVDTALTADGPGLPLWQAAP